MLATSQKADILAKAGVGVPPFPARRLPLQERFLRKDADVPQEERDADAEQQAAVREWNTLVEMLYVEYIAARAARSLRKAEEAERMTLLRSANAQAPRPRRRSDIGGA